MLVNDQYVPSITSFTETHWTKADTNKLINLMKEEEFSPCAKRGGSTVKVHGSTHYYGCTYTFINNKWATRKEGEKHSRSNERAFQESKNNTETTVG